MTGDVHESPSGEPRERSLDELRAELADTAGRMREILAEIDSRTAPPPQPRRLRLIHGAGGLLGLAGIGAALKSRPGAAAMLAAAAVAMAVLLPSSAPTPDAPRPPSIAEPAPERPTPAPPPLEPRPEPPSDLQVVPRLGEPMSTVADGAPPTSTPTTTTPPQQSPPADQPPSEPPADRTTPRPESPAEPEPCLRVEAPPPDADINIDACLDEVLAITGNA